MRPSVVLFAPVDARCDLSTRAYRADRLCAIRRAAYSKNHSTVCTTKQGGKEPAWRIHLNTSHSTLMFHVGHDCSLIESKMGCSIVALVRRAQYDVTTRRVVVSEHVQHSFRRFMFWWTGSSSASLSCSDGARRKNLDPHVATTTTHGA